MHITTCTALAPRDYYNVWPIKYHQGSKQTNQIISFEELDTLLFY
jgi:hypothetical protein